MTWCRFLLKRQVNANKITVHDSTAIAVNLSFSSDASFKALLSLAPHCFDGISLNGTYLGILLAMHIVDDENHEARSHSNPNSTVDENCSTIRLSSFCTQR